MKLANQKCSYGKQEIVASENGNLANMLAPLGRVPSGIFILTARETDGERHTGMLCSWVMQAGFNPPMVSVAVKQGRYVLDWLTGGAPFAVNIVAERGKALLSHFGKGFEPGEEAFSQLAVETGPHGLTLLADDVVGHLICQARSHVDSGDHRILLAEVVAGRLRDDEPPMVHIRNSGKHY